MRYMSDFDLQSARSRFIRSTTPNRLALVMVVEQLREWTDNHSDGWLYWPKPVRACAKAFELIDGYTNQERREQESCDITDAEMLAAVRPIKAFLTRQKVHPTDRELILRAVQVPA